MDKVVKFINFSSVFGGQERYLEVIFKNFNLRGIKYTFLGSPTSLKGGNFYGREYDIVFLNGNSALYKSIPILFSSKFKIYVQHSHINDGQGPGWKKTLRKLLLFIFLKRVDLIIRVCECALPDYYSPRKIVTIYNGVPLPRNITFTNKSQCRNLLMVGALNDNKNQALAIRAIQHIPDVNLTIVGKGELIEDLKSLTESLGLQERVSFPGQTDSPEIYYENSDLLLVLSKFEAFPLVVLESMAHFCPVISVKVGGVPEIIENNVNGWLLDEYSELELAKKIKEIMLDAASYNRVSLAARETIVSRFTEEHMLDELLAEIELRCN